MRGYREPRGPKRWRLRIHLGTRADGSRATYSETFKGSARDADRRLAELVTGFDALEETQHARTFAQLVAEWREVVAPALEASTRRSYLGNLERHVLPRLGAIPVAKITVAELERLYRELGETGLKPATVHQVHSVLSSVLSTAVRWEWIDRNPARATKRAKIEWNPPAIYDDTDLELTKILGELEEEPALLAAVLLSAATGIRRGELCGLRWSDLRAGTLRVERAVGLGDRGIYLKSTKTHAVRTLHLDPGVLEVLRAHRAAVAEYVLEAGASLDADAYVFSDDPAGRVPWRPDRVTRAWTQARDRANSTLRFHDLRHHHISAILETTDDLLTARNRAGHRDISTTNRYAHGGAAADQRAADAVGARLAAAGFYQRR
jgi:integrase